MKTHLRIAVVLLCAAFGDGTPGFAQTPPSNIRDPAFWREQLQARRAELSPQLADATLLADYHKMPVDGPKPVFVPIGKLPDVVIKAFVASIEPTFYTRSEIALIPTSESFSRLLANKLLGPDAVHLPVKERVLRAMLAQERVLQTFSKEQILEIYLNRVFLGASSFGVGAASFRYFEKPAETLELHEAAYLAVLAGAPSQYHPIRNAGKAVERRNEVIDKMAASGYIDAPSAQAAKTKPLGGEAVTKSGN